MSSLFKKLDAHSKLEATLQGKDGVSHNIMSTHPRTADRRTQAIDLAREKRIANPRNGRQDYLERIDGMVFGDDVSQGVRNGRSFVHRDLRFRFAFITRPENTAALNTDFRRTTYSFRRLSDEEEEAIKPLRIKLVTVKPGDTIAGLAATMPFEKYKREWFRVLNAMGKGERLTPGRRVKLVIDR